MRLLTTSNELARMAAWLTSHRLILREHEPGHLEEDKKPEFYHLKNFKKAQITNETLTVHFQGKPQIKIQLPETSLSQLLEIQEYIEQASKNHSIH